MYSEYNKQNKIFKETNEKFKELDEKLENNFINRFDEFNEYDEFNEFDEFNKKTDYKENYDFLNDFDDDLEKKINCVDNHKIPEPTGLRISTMTAISSISTTINLDVINKYIDISDINSLEDLKDNHYNKIIFIAYGNNIPKGFNPKEKKNKKKKPFYNQATIIIKLDQDNRYVNLKIFINGNLQITGLKSQDDIPKIKDIFTKTIINLEGIVSRPLIEGNANNKYKDNIVTRNNKNIENLTYIDVFDKAIPYPEEYDFKDFEIVLINSDYFSGYKINRENLYKIIVNQYGLFSTYEPCIYPGVNIKYFWNSEYDNNGICKCISKCNGKGKGNGDGNCKKITIAAFQSGNVIITGARDIQQILVTYNFINNIFKNHYYDIKKSDLSEIDNLCFSDSDDENDKLKNIKVNKKKIIMIKKSKIKYRQNNIFSGKP